MLDDFYGGAYANPIQRRRQTTDMPDAPTIPVDMGQWQQPQGFLASLSQPSQPAYPETGGNGNNNPLRGFLNKQLGQPGQGNPLAGLLGKMFKI